jgi:hypothetical protein
VTSVGHDPHRPTWDCLGCGKPWPCDPAREEMAGENRITRAILMSMMLDKAAGDMPTAAPGELYERFIAWTRAAYTGSGGDGS